MANNSTEFFSSNSTEETALDSCESSIDDFKLYQFALIPAVVMTILFASTRRRRYKLLDFLDGRPSLPIPMDTMTRSSRTSFAAAFGASGFLIYQIIVHGKLAVDFHGSVYLKVFIQILSMLVYGMVYLPLFTSIALGSAFSFGLGTLYSWMFFAIEVHRMFECNSVVTRSWFIERHLPGLICHIYLAISLPVRFIICLKKGIYWVGDSDEEVVYSLQDVKQSFQGMHVRELLRKVDKKIKVPPTDFCGKFKKALISVIKKIFYKRKKGFRYPARIISVMAVAGTIVYSLAYDIFVVFWVFLFHVADKLKTAYPKIRLMQQAVYFVEVVQVCVIVGTCVAATNTVLTMLHMMSSFRKNLRQVYRGDYHSFPSPHEQGGVSLCIGSMKYAGYQVAHIVWGFFVCWFVISIMCLLFAAIIILMIEDYITDWIIEKIVSRWPLVLVGIVIWVVQTVLAKYVFLQDRGEWLRLDNRRGFFIFTFFTFWYYIFLGVFSCLFRIIKALFVGIYVLARLDNSTLPRKFEMFDPGYRAYQGFIHMQAAHTHPVVITFIRLLSALRNERLNNERLRGNERLSNERLGSSKRLRSNERLSNKILPSYKSLSNESLMKKSIGVEETSAVVNIELAEMADTDTPAPAPAPGRRVNMAARFNWHVTYTLLTNPAIRVYRKGYMQALEIARKEGIKVPISDRIVSDFDLVKAQEQYKKEREVELDKLMENRKTNKKAKII